MSTVGCATLVGVPCGQHGPYTFYKAFRFTKNGVKRIMTLSEFFFVKLWMDSDLLCIGELQLLWVDKNSEQVLASLRLYFLPENTPEGRMDHGEDEVLAISEKVVLRVEDLITWITADADWSWGRLAKCVDNKKDSEEGVVEPLGCAAPRLTESSLDFSDVEKERKLLDIKPPTGPSVIILSYPRYCRYRAVMKRLEGVEDEYLKHQIIHALGGIRVKTKDTRILFCKETFDYPELEGHELLCNHLAPKLKGRPRGKRKKRSISPGSESNESESSVSNVFTSTKKKITTEGGRNGLRCNSTTSPRRSTRSTENSESKDFIKTLSAFMKRNRTPMGRIPSLGYKELDLYSFYTKVQKLGGYDAVTTNRLWKSIFDDLSGNQMSTSAATVIRRHYERFLLAYERHIKGEEHKPLPVLERRRLKSKAGSSSASSDPEMSEGTSRSGNTTPIPPPPNSIPITHIITIPALPTDEKEFITKADIKAVEIRAVEIKPVDIKPAEIKPVDIKPVDIKPLDIKPSSLRSVRVKPERLRDNRERPLEIILPKSPPSLSQEPKEGTKPHIPEKDPEPETGAVAPVQKLSPDKSISPAEGKENIPIYNACEAQHKNSPSSDDDLIEVPYRPKTPEIIDLESDAYTSKSNNNNNNNVNNNNKVELKKGKLDILKEGGLEVTPVRQAAPGKDSRPSVIQIGEKPMMPPPSINASLIKRPIQITPVKSQTQSSYAFNGNSPPKVVQSKSIYAPSQRTVYGDPKDLFGSQIHQVQSPKFIKPTSVIDLTVRSPQKPPGVEIMRMPPLPPPKQPKLPTHVKDYSAYNNSHTQALLGDRRISSNLEITLVGPSKSQQPQKAAAHNYLPKSTHKRNIPEAYTPYKHPRAEENGKTPQMFHPRYKPASKPEPKPPNPYMRPKNPTPPNKYATVPQMYPNYLPQQSNKNVSPYMQFMDPLYLSALQNMYPSPNPVNNMLPMPTPEQLQLYSDLMSRNAAFGSFPFPFPQENITSSDNKVKKQ